jgi:hypothetical protein
MVLIGMPGLEKRLARDTSTRPACPDLRFVRAPPPQMSLSLYWSKVLRAAKTYCSIFYEKLSPSIARVRWLGPVGITWRWSSGETWARSSTATRVPVCRRVSTILEIWSLFHTKMALDTKLKQLALYVISW